MSKTLKTVIITLAVIIVLAAIGYGIYCISQKSFKEEGEEGVKTDRQLIAQALAAKYNKPVEEVEVTPIKSEGKYMGGSVVFAPGGPENSGFFLAVKQDTEWVIAYDGNGAILCSQVEPYDFPIELVNECIDEQGQLVVKDEVLRVVNILPRTSKLNFSAIADTEFEWHVLGEDEEVIKITVVGREVGVTDITDEQYQAVEDLMDEYGFETDVNNIAAGTVSSLTGYKKNRLVCVIIGGAKGYKTATGQPASPSQGGWIPPEPDVKELDLKCGLLDNVIEQVTNEPESMQVNLDEDFSISLVSNATTGYEWQVDYDEAAVELLNEKYIADESGLVGAGGIQRFDFQSLTAGQTQIIFSYLRPWEQDVEPIKIKVYNVTVK